MGQRKARQAQVWAVKLAEELDSFLLRSSVPLPYDLKNYPVVVQGQAIRHCQEVNLAKKQLDALRRQNGSPVMGMNWVLKYRLIDPARQPSDLPDYRPRAVLYVDFARGRAVTSNTELEMTVDTFIAGLRAQTAPPLGTELEPIAPFPGVEKEPAADAQDKLLKDIYGV